MEFSGKISAKSNTKSEEVTDMADCIFCKIAAKEIPATIVYEDETVTAFRDLSPQAPVHILLVPKVHAENLAGLVAREDGGKIAAHIAEVATKIAESEGLKKTGWRLVTNTGEDGGQTVPHLHFHILGGRKMLWPPG